jgi:hypothetical protein
VDVSKISRSAAVGAIEAADRIGATTSRAVRATLSRSVAGVRALAPASRRAAPGRPRRRRRSRAG